MQIGPTLIRDTFAEAFEMKVAGLIVTALDEHWLRAAVTEFCGYSSSVIGCDVEAGCDRMLSAEETPDGRPGARLLAFGRSTKTLTTAIANRTGQCLMTCPTTAVFDGMPGTQDRVALGKHLRYFGDGYQKSKQIAGVRYWRIPVMDGEFLIEERLGIKSGVAGGNLIIEAVDQATGLNAARQAAEAASQHAGIIAPFPGGVVRSGSKVGSRYPGMIASTSHTYCPTLRGRVASVLAPEANCVYEIVLDGEAEETMRVAMSEAMKAAAGEGVVAIGAGNYGGKLGRFQFHLRQMIE